jgi:hypothetical protein
MVAAPTSVEEQARLLRQKKQEEQEQRLLAAVLSTNSDLRKKVADGGGVQATDVGRVRNRAIGNFIKSTALAVASIVIGAVALASGAGIVAGVAALPAVFNVFRMGQTARNVLITNKYARILGGQESKYATAKQTNRTLREEAGATQLRQHNDRIRSDLGRPPASPQSTSRPVAPAVPSPRPRPVPYSNSNLVPASDSANAKDRRVAMQRLSKTDSTTSAPQNPFVQYLDRPTQGRISNNYHAGVVQTTRQQFDNFLAGSSLREIGEGLRGYLQHHGYEGSTNRETKQQTERVARAFTNTNIWNNKVPPVAAANDALVKAGCSSIGYDRKELGIKIEVAVPTTLAQKAMMQRVYQSAGIDPLPSYIDVFKAMTVQAFKEKYEHNLGVLQKLAEEYQRAPQPEWTTSTLDKVFEEAMVQAANELSATARANDATTATNDLSQPLAEEQQETLAIAGSGGRSRS